MWTNGLQLAGGGASFPASPTTNDIFFRTDQAVLYCYDGSRWLSLPGVPIGGIIAWAKYLYGTLPANFVQCDGLPVDDSESPLDGVTLPNLNVGDGTGRFLRGTTGTSGAMQGAFVEAHTHTSAGHVHDQTAHLHAITVAHQHLVDDNSGSPTTYSAVNARGPTGNSSYHVTSTAAGWTDNSAAMNTGSTTPGATGSYGTGTETRPINMTVVWVIRIK